MAVIELTRPASANREKKTIYVETDKEEWFSIKDGEQKVDRFHGVGSLRVEGYPIPQGTKVGSVHTIPESYVIEYHCFWPERLLR